MESSIYAGLQWLVSSPIQDASGGVALDYRSPERERGAITTEATAWYVQGLLLLGECDEHRIERAGRAGRFLMESAFDLSSDLFLTRPVVDGVKKPKTAEFMSCAAAVRALLALFRVTQDFAYLECADRCARALLMRLPRVDGSFFPRYDVALNAPFYEMEPGVEQLKISGALLALSEQSCDRQFSAAADSLAKWAMRQQPLALDRTDDPTEMQRRYALYLEGLLPFAGADFVAGQALQAGIARLESAYDQTPEGSRSPAVLARLLRLRLHADRFGIVEVDRKRACEDAYWLAEAQVLSADPDLHGAFGLLPPDELDAIVDPETAVVSIQALAMWQQSEVDGCSGTWQDLI